MISISWSLLPSGREQAWCVLEGERHQATSKASAVFKLCRLLRAKGIADQPVQSLRERDGFRMTFYPSLHAAADWTTEESAARPVRFKRFVPWEGKAAREQLED